MEAYTSKNEYIRRINKVQDYIEKNISKTFTLEELADIAGFSKYHFHRIFKAMTHESLVQYVNRTKLEKSTQLLGQRDDMSITDIAFYLGFTDSAVFSRSFKHLFKITPRDFRKNYRKNCKDQYNISRYNLGVSEMEKKKVKQEINGQVEVIEISKIKVAYVRFTGNYSELAIHFPQLLEQLFKNAENLMDQETSKVVAIYHDHPEFSDPEHFKTSLGITLPNHVKVGVKSGLSVLEIPAGKYLVGHFYIEQSLYSAIWDYIYEEWLTTSGYVPRDSFPFEMYLNNHQSDPNDMHLVDIYLPVQPIS